jgi:hypothetical protein
LLFCAVWGIARPATIPSVGSDTRKENDEKFLDSVLSFLFPLPDDCQAHIVKAPSAGNVDLAVLPYPCLFR